MTDLERFVELYRSFGIECKVFIEGSDCERRIYLSNMSFDYATTSDKFGGYIMFSEITFDVDGRFIGQGFWE